MRIPLVPAPLLRSKLHISCYWPLVSFKRLVARFPIAPVDIDVAICILPRSTLDAVEIELWGQSLHSDDALFMTAEH